jgi:hypothetical protein
MRAIYFCAALLGLALPYAFFARFLAENGLDLALFARMMFASPVAAFFSLDVMVASAAFWAFLFAEGRRLGMKSLWVYVLLNLLVGVSFALPVFLYARQAKINLDPIST